MQNDRGRREWSDAVVWPCSYFEWVQNLQELIWSEEEVSDRLTHIMQKGFKEVLEISVSKKISMRTAALVLGIGRVAEATRLRGIYP